MKDLKKIIEQGIELEDDFIKTYMSVIKDEGFAQYFETNQAKAEELLQTLITQSTGHKAILENILKNLK